MLQLKLKSPVSVELFGAQIKPYMDKVIDQLGQTNLNKELIVPLEKAIKNKTKRDVEKLFQTDNFTTFKNIYMTIARHIITNLTINNQINNVDLIEQVNSGHITVERLVELSPEEMHVERWRSLIDKKILEVKKLTMDPEATSELFWCGRCHRNKTRWFERQDRSADEPMTIHITCCYCGHKWRN